MERPGHPPGPVAVGAEALLGRLAEERAGLQVEDPLVRRAAVGVDERPLGGPAVRDGQVVERLVARLARGVEDRRHVHHEIEEQALGRTNDRRYFPLGMNRGARVRPAMTRT